MNDKQVKENNFEEYSQEAVPMSARRSMLKPLAVWIGYAFFPSGIAAAITIGGSFSFIQAAGIVFIGCLVLVFISGTMGAIGAKTGLTFGLIAKYVWGSKGGRIAALIPPVGLIGWGGTHLSYAAEFLTAAFNINYYLLCILMAVVFCAIALVGFKYMTWVANLAVPISIVLLGVGAYKGLQAIGGWDALISADPVGTPITVISGITLMVGTFACGTGGGSTDIQRWCKSPFQAVMVSVVTFGIAYTYLMLTGTIISLGAGTTDVVQAFTGLGMLFSATFIVLFLTWTTCETDYYTASLSISASTGIKRKYGVIILPTISCLLAMTHFSQYLSIFLVIMVALIVPLMGVVTADFLVVNRRNYPDISVVREGLVPEWQPGGFIGLILGAATVILTEQVWNIGCPSIQGIVVAFVATIVFGKIFNKPLPEREAKL